jgi:hypothetical protein
VIRKRMFYDWLIQKEIAGSLCVIAYSAIAIVLLFFGIRLFGAPPQIFFWPDSSGYFFPAATYASGGPFAGLYGRSVGYPATLYAVLRFGELRDLYFVQCALTLVTCIAFVASLLVIVRQTRYKTLGLVLTAFFTLLLVSYQPLTNYVSFAMPETLYICLSVVVTFLTLAVWYSNAMGIRLTVFVLGVVLSVANCLVKPHWWGAAIVSIALLGAAWAMTFSRDRVRSLIALVIAIAGSGVLIFEQWNFAKDDVAVLTFGPLTLFCDHLDIVRPTLDENIPANAPQAARQALLEEIDNVLATKDPDWELNGGVNGGENCIYSPKIRTPLSQIFGQDRDLGRFAMTSFVDGVKHNPRAYLAKVLRQFAGVLRAPIGNPTTLEVTDLKFSDFAGEVPIALRDSARSAISTGETSPVFQGKLAAIGYQATRFLFISNHFVFCAFVAALITSCALLSKARDLADRKSAIIFPICLILYLSSLSVVAASHSFDFPRYLHTTVPMVLLTYFTSILVLVTAADHVFRLVALQKFIPISVASERQPP